MIKNRSEFSFLDLPDGLVTNEFAYWNPSNPNALKSPFWYMPSGSLFSKEGWGWSGLPDAIEPGEASIRGNNSSIFRLITKSYTHENVSVDFYLKTLSLNQTLKTPPKNWDGVHIFLRYQSEFDLYYVSVNRRDRKAVIKKKVKGGVSNDGTYYELSPEVSCPFQFKSVQRVQATINTIGQEVLIGLFINGRLAVSARDDGKLGGSPILKPGATGIRADNCQFMFDDFVTEDL